jgi:hypothetical protein
MRIFGKPLMTQVTTHYACVSSVTLAASSPSVSADGAEFGFKGYLKNNIREGRKPGKRTRPDSARRGPLFRRTCQNIKVVSVPHALHFLHPAAGTFCRFMDCWWTKEAHLTLSSVFGRTR